MSAGSGERGADGGMRWRGKEEDGGIHARSINGYNINIVKRTAARDFRPLIFSINPTHLGPLIYTLKYFRILCSNSPRYSNSKFDWSLLI